MIEDGKITYPGADSVLLNWQPGNVLIKEFAVAVLTTLLVYQLTAIFFDVFLRSRQLGTVKISDIASFIAAEETSIRSIVANLGCDWRIARWKYHGVRGQCSVEKYARKPVPLGALLKLIFLIVIIPLINIGGVLLNLENEFRFTFSDVNFGGLAVATNFDSSQVRETWFEGCGPAATKYGRHDEPTGEFQICFTNLFSRSNNPDPSFSNIDSSDPTASRLILSTGSGGSISAQVWAPRAKFLTVKSFEVKSDGQAFLLKQHIDSSDGVKLIERGVQRMFKHCPSNSSRGAVKVSRESGPSSTQPWNKWWITVDLKCQALQGFPMVLEIVSEMLGPVTVVQADRFDVLRRLPNGRSQDSYETVSGSNMPFLKRKRSAASFLVLCICTGVVILVRIVIQFLVANEVHLAIEATLKDAFKIPCCDSMLQNAELVDYRTFGMESGWAGGKVSYFGEEYERTDDSTELGYMKR